jgi:hypothetical protein
MQRTDLIDKLYERLGETCTSDPNSAHIEIHGNQVLGLHLVPGLQVDAHEHKDGIEAEIMIEKNTRIEQPVRICFGLLPQRGVQNIRMRVKGEKNSAVAVQASCTFPNGVDILHTMEAAVSLDAGAEYAYMERHVHSDQGGVRVIPHTTVHLGEGARYTADFELIRGIMGEVAIDYGAECMARSVLEMNARISGRGDDRISITEQASLLGESARAVLTTSIAVRDRARANVRNTIIADAPHARGHVDCKEIVKDRAVATAVPTVKVRHPAAHVTHEAAIGSVDNKQLETLMSRGLSEDEATELIIEGLLSPVHQ